MCFKLYCFIFHQPKSFSNQNSTCTKASCCRVGFSQSYRFLAVYEVSTIIDANLQSPNPKNSSDCKLLSYFYPILDSIDAVNFSFLEPNHKNNNLISNYFATIPWKVSSASCHIEYALNEQINAKQHVYCYIAGYSKKKDRLFWQNYAGKD